MILDATGGLETFFLGSCFTYLYEFSSINKIVKCRRVAKKSRVAMQVASCRDTGLGFPPLHPCGGTLTRTLVMREPLVTPCFPF